MRLERFGLLVLFATALLTAAGAAPRTTERTFPAPESGKLTITTKDGVEIRISGWEKPEIHVLVTDEKGNYKVDFVPSGSSLTINGAYDGPKSKKISTSVVLSVDVPHSFDLALSTEGGGISLQKIEGTIHGRTMGGNLVLADLAGKVDLKTMGGNIQAAHCRIEGPLRTMGGNVSIAAAGLGVDVETMGGNIQIGPVDGPVKAHTAGGSIEVHLGPGAGDCTASTQGGDVTLRVPNGYSGVFSATSSSMPSGMGIVCELPGLGPAQGWKLGSGEHRVSLQTDGGTIRILPAD